MEGLEAGGLVHCKAALQTTFLLRPLPRPPFTPVGVCPSSAVLWFFFFFFQYWGFKSVPTL
jgi:hypothetical protein